MRVFLVELEEPELALQLLDREEVGLGLLLRHGLVKTNLGVMKGRQDGGGWGPDVSLENRGVGTLYMLEPAAGEVQVAACPIEQRTNFCRPLEQVLITPTPFTMSRAGQVSNETANGKGKEIQVAVRVGGNLISLFAWA